MRIFGKHIAQTCGVVAVSVGDNHHVQTRQVDVERFNVLAEDLDIVSCVEQDLLAFELNQRGVQDGKAVLCGGLGSSNECQQQAREPRGAETKKLHEGHP